MEYNLTKSERRFIRSEKARIRSQFLDVKKQEELITELYKKFLKQPKVAGIKEEAPEKPVAKVEIKKKEVKVKNKKQEKKAVIMNNNNEK